MGYAAKLSLITSDVWNPYRWRWFQDFRKDIQKYIWIKEKCFQEKNRKQKRNKGVGKPHGNASQTPKPNSTKKQKQTPKQKQTKRLQSPKHQKGCWKVLVPAI